MFKDAKVVLKVLLCIITLISVFIVPSLIYSLLIKIISNNTICELLANTMYIAILISIYFKSLKKEFIIFKKDIKKYILNGFKWYFLGLLVMVVVNLLISRYIGEISQNETLVRESIIEFPLISFISVVIFAPISEEIVFRHSIMKTFNNKYLSIILSGLLFGLAHIIGLSDSYKDLIFIIPYASLGSSFALMNNESKSVCTSIVYHSIHNAISFCLILFASSLGGV